MDPGLTGALLPLGIRGDFLRSYLREGAWQNASDCHSHQSLRDLRTFFRVYLAKSMTDHLGDGEKHVKNGSQGSNPQRNDYDKVQTKCLSENKVISNL